MPINWGLIYYSELSDALMFNMTDKLVVILVLEKLSWDNKYYFRVDSEVLLLLAIVIDCSLRRGSVLMQTNLVCDCED